MKIPWIEDEKHVIATVYLKMVASLLYVIFYFHKSDSMNVIHVNELHFFPLYFECGLEQPACQVY